VKTTFYSNIHKTEEYLIYISTRKVMTFSI